MQNKNTILLIILIILVAVGVWFLAKGNEPRYSIDQQLNGTNTNSPITLDPSVIGPNAKDLISFSVKAGETVSGKMKTTGVISGGYFFEANIVVNILDANKKLMKAGNGMAVGDWMTAQPTAFSTNLDFTGLPSGPAYIEIKNDNASGDSAYDKQILIPIVIANTMSSANTYIYKNHGFMMELPKGYVPQEVKGETGPTISIALPGDSGWLIYITDATWWEKYNLTGQATFIRNEKIGSTTFKVYKYPNANEEFYFFRQGNVAYVFNGDIEQYMKTFKFVGWNL